MQKAKDQGKVRMTRRALTPVRKTAQGPGPVGSALNDLKVCLKCITVDRLVGLYLKLFFHRIEDLEGVELSLEIVDDSAATGSTSLPQTERGC